MNQDKRFEGLISEGLAASSQGDTKAALEKFAQASNCLPGSGLPHFLIASEHASSGNVDAAEAAFANAVLLAPDFTLARYQLGLLQFSSARAATALLTWKPLLELPDSDPLPHFVRGFASLAQDAFPAALEHFRRGLVCDFSNPALAADVTRVVEQIELQFASHQDPAVEPAASHILLAGYARGLH